jgi:hypothetical protein
MKNQQTSQQLPTFTLFDSKRIMQFFASIVAIPWLMLIHTKVGIRTYKSSRLIGLAMFLMFLSGLANINLLFFHPAGALFDELPWAILIGGFIIRRRRWQELSRGEFCHSYSTGISYLEKLPLPAFLRSHRKIYTVVEPVLCFIASMIFGIFVSVAVARFFALSAVALAIYQQALYDAKLEADLDKLDLLIQSEVDSETVKIFTDSQSNQEERFFDNSTGTSTGVDINLSRQIEKLRAKQKSKAQGSEQV